MPLRNAEHKIITRTKQIVSSQRFVFQAEIKLFRSATESALFHKRSRILQLREKLSDKSLQLIREQHVRLESMAQTVRSMDPREALRRGYSITMHEGKIVTNLSDVKEGGLLNTLVFGGNIISTVQSINKEEKYE